MTNFKIVTSIDDINIKKWDEFVLNHPKGNLFFSKEFYYTLKDSNYYDSIIVACLDLNNDQLVGILVASIQKEYKGILGPLTKRCIVLGEPLALNDDLEVQFNLIKILEQNIKGNVVFTQYRFFEPINIDLHNFYLDNNYYYEPHLNIINDTTIGTENIWDRINKKRRRGIKSHQSNDFVFCSTDYDENVDVFYELLRNTYKKIKIPFPKKDFFHSIKKNMKRETLKFFELRYKGITVLSLLGILWKNTLYTYYRGSTADEEIIKKHSNDIFYWELLKWCGLNGVTTVNWMGAGNKNKEYGVRNYKKTFGGVVFEPGRMSKFNNRFVKISYKLLFALWRKFN